MKRILVTGGSGFIGTNLILNLLKMGYFVLNIDKLNKDTKYTNKFHPANFYKNYKFIKLDITKKKLLMETLLNFKPDTIYHLAAESHVDNSIENPSLFMQSNIIGTYTLLDSVREMLSYKFNKNFKLINISTDEVYGSIKKNVYSKEDDNYFTSSPYSASKASSVHLADAWIKTFDLPIITTFSSNNFGSYQSPEKLIPKTIIKSILREKFDIYGKGKNVRNWISVNDNVEALIKINKKGKVGEKYNIGGLNNMTNIEIIDLICGYFNSKHNGHKSFNYFSLKRFVKDRPGHDFRYALNTKKIDRIINIKKNYENFYHQLIKTIIWYENNFLWWKKLLDNKILSRKCLL